MPRFREVLFVSEGKLEWEFSEASSLDRRKAGGEVSIGLPGNGMKVLTPAGSLSSVEIAAKLEKVIRHIDRRHRPQPFEAPGLKANLRPNQWITFDLNMRYGTARQDSATSGAPHDVVLFGGSVQSEGGGDGRSLDLLLCGSIQHLRSRVASYGRMGSNTDWLYDFASELNRREWANVHVIPEFPTATVPHHHSSITPEHVAHEVFGGLMRSTHPRPDYSRLCGHARVLMDIDNAQWATRLVIATPLYIERATARSRRRWWPSRRADPGMC
ncbi:SAVMC3_10250 family protein [Nocardia cyriacigeorgica]|uniref:SAVMC3_10250 family protein n=1 Tax=Nocardia cyriacigeorgica TaxID=135487 RepID=UPI003D79A50E